MMVQDELSNYVLEEIKDFRQKSVEEIENWLQDEEPKNDTLLNDVPINVEKFINDLSLEILYEDEGPLPSDYNVLNNVSEVKFGGNLNNTQINNIIAEYRKYNNSILPENSHPENLGQIQILSLVDSAAVADKNLSPACPEQTDGGFGHGNLIVDTVKTINEIINNNDFVKNQQVQNNIESLKLMQQAFEKGTSVSEKSVISPLSITESLSIAETTNNYRNDLNFCTNFTNNPLNDVASENSLEHHDLQTKPNNYNVENKGLKLVIKKINPEYSVYTKGQSTEGEDSTESIFKQSGTDDFATNSNNQEVSSENRSNPKLHLEIVTRALATVNITDQMLKCTRTDDNQKLWFCHMPNCQNTYRKLCYIKEHLLTHFGLKPFQCDFENCKWAFSSIFKLRRHQKSHANAKEHACPEPTCKRRFSTASNLAIHRKTHERANDFACPAPDCAGSFPVRKALEKHMRDHHSDEYATFVCGHPGCDRRFFGCSAFMSHQRVHSYAREDLACPEPGCGKVFDIPSRLKYHMISHRRAKSHQCLYCDATFPTASKRSRHERTHNDERQFACAEPGCGKKFLRMDHLKTHMLTHKIVREEYVCDYCHCRFITRTSVQTHVKKHLNGHFEKLKKPQKRHMSKSSAVADARGQYHCARTQPFRNLNKGSKVKSIDSGTKKSNIDRGNKRSRQKEVKKQTGARKVKRSHSEKENVAPLVEVQNNDSAQSFETSPSFQEECTPMNQDVASTAFGEDYPALGLENFESGLLAEELPPLYTQESLEVPKCQVYNVSSDGNNTKNILDL